MPEFWTVSPGLSVSLGKNKLGHAAFWPSWGLPNVTESYMLRASQTQSTRPGIQLAGRLSKLPWPNHESFFSLAYNGLRCQHLVGTTFFRFPFVHDPHDVLKRPEPVSYANFHRGRNFQCLVNPHEVVPDRIERDHVTVILELLGKGIRQAREPAHALPHGKVLTLHV